MQREGLWMYMIMQSVSWRADHGPSPVPAKESYEAMRVVSAIEESARTGGFVNL